MGFDYWNYHSRTRSQQTWTRLSSKQLLYSREYRSTYLNIYEDTTSDTKTMSMFKPDRTRFSELKNSVVVVTGVSHPLQGFMTSLTLTEQEDQPALELLP
jgi:hypothetical protein